MEMKQTKIHCNLLIVTFGIKGFCKQRDHCLFYHSKEDYQEHYEIGRCSDPFCKRRHRSICKHWSQGRCSRGQKCGLKTDKLMKEEDIVETEK